MKKLLIGTCCTVLVLTLSLNTIVAAEPANRNSKSIIQKKAEPSESADTPKAAPQKQKLIDINSATDAELKAIPGLDDAFIAKIVANRPYANKSQLVSRKVLPESVYEKVKFQIIAKQPKREKAMVKPDAGKP